MEFVLSEEAGPPLAFAGQSYSFPFWEPHLLQLSLAGTKPKMMQTESKHLIAVVGIKLAAGMELKKIKKWFLTLTTLDDNIAEPASEEKTLGGCKNDVLHWNVQEKSFFCQLFLNYKRFFFFYLLSITSANTETGWCSGALLIWPYYE